MENSGIPIETLFGTAPLINTRQQGTPSSTLAPAMATMGILDSTTSASEPVSKTLKIVNERDSLPYLQNDEEAYRKAIRHVYRIYVKGIAEPLGFVHGYIIVEFPWPDFWTYSANDKSLVFDGGNNVAERNKLLSQTMLAWDQKTWRIHHPGKPFDAERNQRTFLMPVYSSGGEHVMDVDGSTAEMLGLPTYMVILIAWTNFDDERHYWIPQLESSHSYFPGQYDSLITVGLSAGDNHFERIKEVALNAAGLPTDMTSVDLRYCGTVSYITRTHKKDSIYTISPRVQYVYEIEMARQTTPLQSEDCQTLFLFTPEEVYDVLVADKFTQHSQMPFLDHFIRHGYINATNEPKLEEIQTRLHRKIEFPEVCFPS